MAVASTTAALLAAGIAAGGSAASGALSNRGRTSTSTPSYTPGQKHMQNQLQNHLDWRVNNPKQYFDPLKVKAKTGTNRAFDSVSARMDRDMAGRGFGSSGSGVRTRNKRAVEVSRAGALSGVENDFAGKEIAQDNFLMQMMQQFGFAQPGHTVTQPGNMLGGAVSGGVETATLLYALSQMGGGNQPGGGLPPGATIDPNIIAAALGVHGV